MFKVVSGSKSLGEYFESAVDFTGTSNGKAVAFSVAGPQLISMLEDQIQGFAGAGERDRDA